MTTATPQQVRAWIAQARADLEASRALDGGVLECHRRYWIQQSYEKAIKAYALMRWTGAASDGVFKSKFLLEHSPLKTMSTQDELSKGLHLLLREVHTFINDLGNDHAKLLRRIDDGRPSVDPTTVSYRYPFLVGGEYLPPAQYGKDEWDAYQGNSDGARKAVHRFLKTIEDEYKVFARTPK